MEEVFFCFFFFAISPTFLSCGYMLISYPQTKTKPAKIREMYWKPKKSVGENGTTQGF